MSGDDELEGAAAVAFAAQLRVIATDVVNWQTEYVDDRTGDRWLLDYPNSGAHGGGSPRLRRLPLAT